MIERNKMRNLIVFILVLTSFRSYSQSSVQNLKKYWYYRQRLVNDFVLVGDCQGCSLPASERALLGGNSMKWGDGKIMFSLLFCANFSPVIII